MKDEIDKIISKAKKEDIPQWHDFKRKMFMESYLKHDGNCNAVARDLGIHRIQAYRYKAKWVVRATKD